MKKLLGLLVISGAVLGALFSLTQLSVPGASQATPAFTLKPANEIRDGAIVTVEYTLTDNNGEFIESTSGKEPLTYIHGAGQIMPGLERALFGLKVGDQKKVQVSPEEGYGLPDEKAFQEIPKDKIPPDAQKVGAMLMTKSEDGRMIPIRIHKVTGNTVVVDFNHPLAGKTLNFDVKVKDIKAAEAK
ncbi:MAG: peptidylprolyl isomerase [Deltaproteobacteria bacterium]|nr:peptidylprolyl isomerase [Deltaproteobacteria bacterium]